MTATPLVPRRGALTPIGVDALSLDAGFWGGRQQVNREATIAHAAAWMERLDWLRNLETARSETQVERRGREFTDSDCYKLIEAISWDLARDGASPHGDLLERLVGLVVGAQEPDGYLNTMYGRPWQKARYSDLAWGHELYCAGHLMQAAVAHHRATGDPRLLDVARRLADHICLMFGADGLDRVCGHPEIELGLAELARETGDDRYLEQARIFVARRGLGTLPATEFGSAYWQDDVPVREATILRGHAVRALYLAAGAVDVAVETGDDDLLDAVARQFDRTVARRTYVTGGMGSQHMDEAFGEDFVLPPDRSYCESCAGVASVMVAQRLLLATGEARYADLIERTLYNVVAACPSPEGTAFFYANTLHQRSPHGVPTVNADGVVIRGGASGRQPWFEVSCCPPNVARTLASLAAYAATGDESAVQIHQFAAGTLRLGATVLRVATAYPDEGTVRVTAERTGPGGVAVSIRVPAWAGSAELLAPGGTERVGAGYTPARTLSVGETLELRVPIAGRVSHPDGRIDAVRGTVAIERGPEVLALESVDLPAGMSVDEVALDLARPPAVRDGRVRVTLRRRPPRMPEGWPYGAASETDPSGQTIEANLVPYHSWATRGPSTMRVWIPVANGSDR